MDIDYSPTGREFVTGSYDRTVSFISDYGSLLALLNDLVMRLLYFVGENISIQWWSQSRNLPHKENAKVYIAKSV